MNGNYKLECYITLSWKKLARDKHSRLVGLCVSYEAKKCCEYSPWVHIYNTLYSLQFTNGPKQVDCYIILGWKKLAIDKHSRL